MVAIETFSPGLRASSVAPEALSDPLPGVLSEGLSPELLQDSCLLRLGWNLHSDDVFPPQCHSAQTCGL